MYWRFLVLETALGAACGFFAFFLTGRSCWYFDVFAKWLLLLSLLLPGGPAAAAPAPTLRFDQLSVDQGLAQESVLAIAQDRQGYMWFGSQSGLSRYDGYRMVVYKNIEGDKTSLADNWVGELHVDSQGQLWVGTDNGLDRFDAASQTFIALCPGRKEQARQWQPSHPRHS